MFWINVLSDDPAKGEHCFVFEIITIARVMADKLERQGFEVEIILDQD